MRKTNNSRINVNTIITIFLFVLLIVSFLNAFITVNRIVTTTASSTSNNNYDIFISFLENSTDENEQEEQEEEELVGGGDNGNHSNTAPRSISTHKDDDEAPPPLSDDDDDATVKTATNTNKIYGHVHIAKPAGTSLNYAATADQSWIENFMNRPRKFDEVRDDCSNHYCVGDSHHNSCCKVKHCDLVRKSTLLSTCCNNSVTFENDELSLEYPLLITATPRSGTVFMTNFLNDLGIQLSKDSQYPKEHGMVSWVHVFKDSEYDPFPTLQAKDLHGSKFKVIWHQLRDPLKCLTSIAFTEPLVDQKYLDYLQRHISLSDSNATVPVLMDPSQNLEQILIRRALEFYLQWHTFIQSLRVPMFRLEDIVERKNMTAVYEIFRSINKTIPEDDKILGLMDEDASINIAKKKRINNQREHREVLNWTELCKVDIELTKRFLEMSRSFGYYQDILPDELCV